MSVVTLKATDHRPSRKPEADTLPPFASVPDLAVGLSPRSQGDKVRICPGDDKLAIALANKIASIAWGVLDGGRNFEVRPMNQAA